MDCKILKSKTMKIRFWAIKVGLNEASKQYQTKQHRTGITSEVLAALVGEKLTKDIRVKLKITKDKGETKVESLTDNY